MTKKHKVHLFITALLPIQILLLQWLKTVPHLVEKYYSLGLYPFITKISRTLFGWIPFSVGDLFYTGIAILAIRWIITNTKRIKSNGFSFISEILATVSIVYFMFHLLWGFNYYREPIHKSIAIDNTYTTEELVTITNQLIKKSNALHTQLGFADTTKIEMPYSQQELFDKTQNGYDNVAQAYPTLTFKPQSIKKSLWSLGLTYIGYSGYLNPFSNEAQVNGLIKTYKFPVVSAHETAHQVGYAAENEANFIAMLTTIKNDDPIIQYTGYIFALRYCLSEVARRNLPEYHHLRTNVHLGILKSYQEMSAFWASYENPFEILSKNFYNIFLKANNQSKGIKSYSYMVALVVNYFENENVKM